MARRVELGRTRQWAADALGISTSVIYCWESGRHRPSLATVDALARLYDTSLLTVLGAALPQDATQGPTAGPATLGGSHADAVTNALLAWEAAGVASTLGRDGPASTYRRHLGGALRALRKHRGMTHADLRPMKEAGLKHMEYGVSRPFWPQFVALAAALGVGPLAPVAWAHDPGPDPGVPLASLLACGDRCILDPRDADRRARVAVPGAPTILAAVLAWSSTIGTWRRSPSTADGPRARTQGRTGATSRSSYALALGDAVARLRRHGGLTQDAAAQALGLTDAAIQRCETGRGAPLDLLAALCAKYGTGLLPLLIHLDTPGSTDLPAAVGGDDEARIVAALTAWSRSWTGPVPERDPYRARLGAVLREARGVPQGDVVEATGISVHRLSSIELARRPAPLSVLGSLADHYGLELLPLLAHAADPDGWPLDRPIGGADAPRIRAALLTWQTRPPDYRPPPPLALGPLGRPAPLLPPPGSAPYREGLALLLRNLRVSAGETQCSAMPDNPRTVQRAESPSCDRPTLAVLAALGDRYKVPLLSLLGRVIDPDADKAGPLGGDAARSIANALLLWQATKGRTAADETPEGDFARALAGTLRALRVHRGITFTAGSWGPGCREARRYEHGRRVTWRALASFCDVYRVGPLALLAYAAAPIDQPPASALIACGQAMILDPGDPQRQRRIEVPGAATILAALHGWAS